MICCKCSQALPLLEFQWIRLKKCKVVGKGREIIKGKVWEPKIKQSKWRTYCKPCAKKGQGNG